MLLPLGAVRSKFALSIQKSLDCNPQRRHFGLPEEEWLVSEHRQRKGDILSVWVFACENALLTPLLLIQLEGNVEEDENPICTKRE